MHSLPIHSTKTLTYDRPTKLWTTDASELTMGGAKHLFGQVYPDACDEGFRMQSERTGVEADFVIVHEQTSDGETVYWDLEMTAASMRKLRYLVNFESMKIRVYND